MPDDTKNRNRLSLEERLVMREQEVDILLATIHAERARINRLRAALRRIAFEEAAPAVIATDALDMDKPC